MGEVRPRGAARARGAGDEQHQQAARAGVERISAPPSAESDLNVLCPLNGHKPECGRDRAGAGRGPTIDDVAAVPACPRRRLVRAQRPARHRRRHPRPHPPAAAELGWQPSTRARALSEPRAYALGLILTRDPCCSAPTRSSPPSSPASRSSCRARATRSCCRSSATTRAPRPAATRASPRGRVDGVFLTDLRFDDPRIALCLELGLPAVTIGRPDRRARSRRSASTTAPASPTPCATSPSSATSGSPTSRAAGPPPRRAPPRTPGSRDARAGARAELLEIADFTAAGGAPPRARCSACERPAHRDRLRQRRDGDRRARRRPGPRASPSRTSSRSSATTTPSWPPTSTRPSPPSALTPSAGAAPRPGSCWTRSTAAQPTSSWPRPASWSAPPPTREEIP